MQAANDTARSEKLDAIRGVAILMVLTNHYFVPVIARRTPIFTFVSNMMWTGVDLFFILSGFLLGGILLRNKNSTPYFVPFYGRRALRILPLYIICVVFFFMSNEADSESVWPFAFFVQNIQWTFENRWGAGAMVPTWSLAVEEQFYLVLPLVLRLVSPRSLPRVLITLIVLAPFFRAAAHFTGYPLGAYYLLPCRMDSLFIGVLIAWGTQQPIKPVLFRPGVLTIVTVLSGCGFSILLLCRLTALDWSMSVIGYSVIAIFYGAGFAMLVGSPSLNKGPLIAILSLFGLGAYSIYLFHLPIIHFLTLEFGPNVNVLAIATISVCVVAWCCWRFIEKPCIRLGHRLLQYERAPDAAISS
jgi:peptidoglycan/LPS O-acetylase OafA/YrhL